MPQNYLPPRLLAELSDELRLVISDVVQDLHQQVHTLQHKNQDLSQQLTELQNQLEMFSAEREEMIEILSRFQGIIMENIHNQDALPDVSALDVNTKKILYAFKYVTQGQRVTLMALQHASGLDRTSLLLSTDTLIAQGLMRCGNLDELLANAFYLTDRGNALLKDLLKFKVSS